MRADEEQPLVSRSGNGSNDSTATTTASYTGTGLSSSLNGNLDDHSTGTANTDHNWEPLSPLRSMIHPFDDPHDVIKTPVKAAIITKGHILLLIVAILYGSLNVSLRGVYALPDPPSPSALSTVRGWLAVVCFIPFLVLQKQQQQQQQQSSDTTVTANSNIKSPSLWLAALELAVWNFGAQALVNVGLTYIPSARAAFFTQLSVVMTPGLSYIVGGQRLRGNVLIACAIALMGLILLSKKEHSDDDDDSTVDDASNSGGGFTLGFGDIITLCGALSWSTYIYRLGAIGDRYDDVTLQALKNTLLASLYTIWMIGEIVMTQHNPWVGWHSLVAWALLFYSALSSGCIADVLQQQGQATVTATVANILLSTEPVWTAIFGRILLGELTSGLDKMGGCLILIAAIVSTLGQQ